MIKANRQKDDLSRLNNLLYYNTIRFRKHSVTHLSSTLHTAYLAFHSLLDMLKNNSQIAPAKT